MRIELLASPGCRNAAKQTVTDCLSTLGLDMPIMSALVVIRHRRSSSTAST
ncbi:hypothetical protein L838_3148 [Mycobacterium avium MAV_120709_2344]|nr:hypothetical protein L838_3148 [Mycobacterium avium MAV_120709_2344]